MKLAGTVILYHPSENMIDNILSYCRALQKLYVFDNTEGEPSLLEESLKHISNVAYYHDKENRGIAERLNKAADLAITEGYQWLLTMDQDSFFEKEYLDAYIKCIASFTKAEQVSMFGVNYLDAATKNADCIAEDTSHLITSGSIVNLNLFNTIGGFDENLFIDEVDQEYCYRSIKKKFRIIKFNNIYLQHNLGTKEFHRSLKNLQLTYRTLHSPIRLYYMVRNHLYIRKKYWPLFKKDIVTSKRVILNRIKNYLLYGKDKIKLSVFIFQAYTDFKANKMGKKRM